MVIFFREDEILGARAPGLKPGQNDQENSHKIIHFIERKVYKFSLQF